ncbi:YbjQ family protein [bacterium]|nr:YbjQ family protein [bacterium]MCG2678341.1 YbjQ family protein [bacterium]
MNNVRIFTTPILDGIKIKEYKGLVIVRNVRAINVVRDFFTVFRDFFGGRSGSYQKVIKVMQDEIITETKEEVKKLGANAIVDFSLDFENIGSKRKSLLMATAKGTAVIIE